MPLADSKIFSFRDGVLWGAKRLLPRLIIGVLIIAIVREWFYLFVLALAMLFMSVIDFMLYERAWSMHTYLLRKHGAAYESSLIGKLNEFGLPALLSRGWADFEAEFESQNRQT